MPKTTDPPEPRVPLSRERVLRAAIALADTDGVDSLSMRRLARALGVEAMSLYNHVANKDALLDGMIDLVATEMEFPETATDWKAALRASAISAKEVFLRHRWASRLWMSRSKPGPGRLRHAEWTLRTLRQAGFPPFLTHQAFHILDSHIFGATFLSLSFPYQGEAMKRVVAGFLSQFDADAYPYMIEHAQVHLDRKPGDDGGFLLGLEFILDGLDRLRLAEPAS